jgi:hypothetical protein
MCYIQLPPLSVGLLLWPLQEGGSAGPGPGARQAGGSGPSARREEVDDDRSPGRGLGQDQLGPARPSSR